MTATNGKKQPAAPKLPPEVLAKPAEEDERTLTNDDRRTVLGEVGPIDTTADPAAVASEVKRYHRESQRSATRSVLCRWYMGRALLAMWIRLAPERQWEKWCREVGLSSQEVSRCMRLARAFRQAKEIIGLTWGEACRRADEVIQQQRQAEGRKVWPRKKEQDQKKQEHKKQEEKNEQDQNQNQGQDQQANPAADIPDILPFPAPVAKRAPKQPRAKAEEEFGMAFLPAHLVMFAASDLHEAIRRLAGRPVTREDSVNIRANLEAVHKAADLLVQLVMQTRAAGAKAAAQ